MRRGLCLVGLGMLMAGSSPATDTAFWKPYQPDAATFYLASFDAEGAPEGRFGGAWRGHDPLPQDTPQLLLGGLVSLECWVKLDALPVERAYPIRRHHREGATRGFGLFIEPSGAFGVAVRNCLGSAATLLSEPDLVPVGAWVHLAAISYSTTYQVLYLNGEEVARETLAAQQGLSADGQQETEAAPVVVGEGVPGLLDEVRVHTNVAKLWPRPRQGWIGEQAGRELPPAGAVLAPGRRPVLHLALDGEAVVDHPDLAVRADGAFVDGVRGRAFRGVLSLGGPMAGAEQGALEFWSRPVGVNNYSDQNIGLLNGDLFTLYLFNTTRTFRPLTLYYYDREKEIHFAGDRLGTEVYPGKWDHFVISWGSGKVAWYVNGEQAGGTEAEFGAKGLGGFTFNAHRLYGDVDEVYVYDRELSPVEIANTYWRYRDPARLQPARPKLADLRFWHLPSSRQLYAQIRAVDEATAGLPVRIQLRNARDDLVFAADAAFAGGDQHFILPELEGGEYRINLRVGEEETDPQVFKRERFGWEGNQLGMTDEVFPPFTPVVAGEETVSVVLRDHRMNAFGLWAGVVAEGREILAGPVRLAALDEQGGEFPFEDQALRRNACAPNRAEYAATGRCAAFRYETESVMEPDGMMKVTLRLEPAPEAVPLQRLSLEIPLRDEVAWLLHESADTIRRGYSGALAAGDGEVWNSLQSLRSGPWLNAFTGYIWLGGPERGLAWFAENDRGWITAKNHEQPLMRIFRGDGAVTLRVDLVNVPGVVAAPTGLVFGLQASPTRPVPVDYRSKALTLPGVGLPVHPWGGLSCSWKSPWMDRWQVVDKVIEGRNQGRVDRAWFEAFQREFDVPKVHGVKDWVGDVLYFASRTTPLTHPDPVYFEEMAVLPFIPEYHVFQDEWSLGRLPERTYASVDVYRTSGGLEINPSAKINFTRSYQDYALALADQWMKRGVSMYWDNTYLKVSVNPWTSAAYRAADGRIQPATTLWNQRQYLQRTWNLINHWRRQGVPRPLEFVAHMTNANLLPLFSWSTCNYDIEMDQGVYAQNFPDVYEPGEPYAPEFLLAESTGLQVGAYPYLVHSIFAGQCKLPGEALGCAPGPVEVGRREWGMRMVHEIISGGPENYILPGGILNKAVYAFGYGSDMVDVWNYWDDEPAFTVDRDRVKGLLLSRPGDRRLLLVLQSWSKEPVEVTVTFRPEVIGFEPGAHVYDALRNRHGELTGGALTTRFEFPYGTGIYVIDDLAPDADVLFADDFEQGLNPGWDYVSHYATLGDGGLRLGRNAASWQGNPRVFKWLNLPDFSDAQLNFSFRIEQAPAAAAEVLSVRFPADGVEWSKHGLTHSYVNGGWLFQLLADPDRGWAWRASGQRDGKPAALGEGVAGTVDAGTHAVRIAVEADGSGSVAVDGEEALSFRDAPVSAGSAFGIAAVRDPAAAVGAVFLDDIVLRAARTDYARLERAQAAARARSAEALAGQTNELKQAVIRVFGARRAPEIYKLALFRHPERDVAQLVQLIRAAEPGHQRALLALLQELPAREREHAQSMEAIGQPAERLPEFKQARSVAAAFLRSADLPDEASAQAAAEALASLEPGE